MTAVAQTRQQYYDKCVVDKSPLPEIQGPADDRTGANVNSTDIRYIDDATGKVGPWARTDESAKAQFDAM